MEPIFKDIKAKKTLLNPITFNGQTFTEVNVNKLILRPVLQRIVFIVDELDRVIVYEGATDYTTHKDDSEDTLIAALLTTLDTKYKA